MTRVTPLPLAGILGFVAGWLTSSAGGAPERFSHAVIVASVSLVVAGFVPAALAGAGNGWRLGTVVTLAAFLITLFAYYIATLVYSPFHSVLGDAIFLIGSSVPASIAAASGLVVGRLSRRRVSGTAG